MVIEQAFYNLPEILVGSGYAKQEYEAGIVSAFSLAILQELNGRNAPNPISFLCAEKRFSKNIDKLRADIHVRLANLYSGSRDYSEFGFRHSNWIEAKFFRLGKGTPPSTQNLGSVVADLFRLIALVPIEPAKDKDGQDTNLTITGRYFLHIYYGDPLKHLNPNKKQTGEKRKWVKKLFGDGFQKIDGFDLATETDSFFTLLGTGFKTATCKLNITNFRIEPRSPAKENYYSLFLGRIESAELSFNGRTYSFNSDRTFNCNPVNEFANLQLDVAKTLKPKKASEKKSDNDDNEADE
jgi:hypothetical protein